MGNNELPEWAQAQVIVSLASTNNKIMIDAVLKHYAAFLEKQFGIPAADTIEEVRTSYLSSPGYRSEKAMNEFLLQQLKDVEENHS